MRWRPGAAPRECGPAARVRGGLAPLLSVALAAAMMTQAGTARALDAAAVGRKLFTEKTCATCHNVGAPSAGLGPELTQVTWHRDSTWLVAWLTDPPKIKKDTPMPRLDWKSPAEMQAVIAYLMSSRVPIPAADSADGQKLFAGFKCGACHALNRKGGKPQFPDLGRVGRRRDAAWLDRWLADPQAVRKGTFEPRFPLSATQRRALVTYLEGLK
ncbi:MAG: cytochrome c [Candidatus Eisenbacteria bacterium]|nr:cytochrome c [Candidatus Eisenbacteria bacterium]